MKQLKLLVVLAPLMLAGCGGGQEAPTAQDDAQWEQAMTAGKDSFDLGRYSVAMSQYRRAANLALLRDDGSAVAESGYNLAVAQLAADQPQMALQTIQAARQAASVRGTTHSSAFDLVQAAALYRTKESVQAITFARHAAEDADPEVKGRAALIMALAAEDVADLSTLQQAHVLVQGLAGKLSRSLQADKAEISARYAMGSNPAHATSLAEQAAALWRDDAAYTDMARALALAGQAASRAGDTERAKTFLARAAQSAAIQAQNTEQTDATTLVNGALQKGESHTARSDAAQWRAQAGSNVILKPFEAPKTP